MMARVHALCLYFTRHKGRLHHRNFLEMTGTLYAHFQQRQIQSLHAQSGGEFLNALRQTKVLSDPDFYLQPIISP